MDPTLLIDLKIYNNIFNFDILDVMVGAVVVVVVAVVVVIVAVVVVVVVAPILVRTL